MVSFSQGRVFSASAQPPQRSTTISPSSVAQNEAPTSAPEVRLVSNAARTAGNRSPTKPPIDPSAMVPSSLIAGHLIKALARAPASGALREPGNEAGGAADVGRVVGAPLGHAGLGRRHAAAAGEQDDQHDRSGRRPEAVARFRRDQEEA